MISVERSFYDRFPQLEHGHSRKFAQPVVALLRRIACEERINGVLAALDPLTGFEFVEQALRDFDVSYNVANTDRENIPVDGRMVIVANHPLGALDALALIDLVGSVRRDVKILANDVLMQLDQLRSLLLPLPVFGGTDGKNSAGLREAYRSLEREEALIVFPAGTVSRIGAQGVRDMRWSEGFVRLALKTSSPVLPVHINAHNSPVFYGVSMVAKPLSALLLAREMFGAARTRIGFSIGASVPVTALSAPKRPSPLLAQRMRAHVYRLPRRRPAVFPTSTAIAHPESPLAVRAALQRAEVLGATRDGKRILLIGAQPDCPVLREIGRLRELAFRRVGEGSGTRRDLDRFDGHYKHLLLWDEYALQIVGAYRIGEGGDILAKRGIDGFYSSTLFDWDARAHEFLRDSIELGRSFVQPAYWGSRSLDYLWQGIGAYLRTRPNVRYLVGPVSLSATLPQQSREWIVHCHRHYFGDPDRLARARRSFNVSPEVSARAHVEWCGCDSDAGLRRLDTQLRAEQISLPVLYRQYVELCEPDGVRFLDFGVDPAFGACVDGLIRLDLEHLRSSKRKRYIDRHSGTDANQGSTIQRVA